MRRYESFKRQQENTHLSVFRFAPKAHHGGFNGAFDPEIKFAYWRIFDTELPTVQRKAETITGISPDSKEKHHLGGESNRTGS